MIYLLSLVTDTLQTVEVCPCKTASCFFSKRFHILIVLSSEPETIYLLSLVTVRVKADLLWPSKTVSCAFSKRFQTLIFLSSDPEMIYLLSLVTSTLVTPPKRP